MKIIHIGQKHKSEFHFEQCDIENTVQSQFRVAQKIRKYRHYPILTEGLYEDLLDAPSQLFSDVASTLFDRGFPTDFNVLTEIQKTFLYRYGAARTLFWLGAIPAVYKTADNAIDIATVKKANEGISDYDTVHGDRDIYAVKCAKEVASKLFKNTDDAVVIIVLGLGHSDGLQKICEQEAIEYQLVDTVYQPDFITQVQPAFFTPTTNCAVPKELVKILKDGNMVQNCVTKGHVTQEKLIELHREKPWIVDALRCANIYNGICNDFINVEQLDQLTEKQVASVIHKFSDAELKEQVEAYIELNQRQVKLIT